MNQIDIFRAFSIWSRYNMPTANQRSLFYGLLEVWNDTRLVRSDEWLSVPNRTLETISGLSQKTCDNVKNQLQQQGILKIIPGKRNKDAAKYNISFWINVKKEEDFTVTPTVTVTPKLSSDVTVTSTAKLSSYTEKSRKENIREEKDDVVIDKNSLQFLADFFSKNFHMISSWELEQLKEFVSDSSHEMVQLALEIAIENNGRNINYVRSILANWEKANIKTPAGYQAYEAERKRKFASNASKSYPQQKTVKPAPSWSNQKSEKDEETMTPEEFEEYMNGLDS